MFLIYGSLDTRITEPNLIFSGLHFSLSILYFRQERPGIPHLHTWESMGEVRREDLSPQISATACLALSPTVWGLIA